MTKGICTVDDCFDYLYTRNSQGYCCRHYRRWQRYGDPLAGGPLVRRTRRLPHSATRAERFWAKVDTSGDCWIWLGALNDQGYGVVIRGGKWIGAHRESWEIAGRRLDPALTLDHTCHNVDLSCAGGPTCRHRRCVNPAHLEQVTRAVNTARGRSSKTHCLRGHEFTAQNTYVQPKTGGRFCRQCGRINVAAYRLRKREHAA